MTRIAPWLGWIGGIAGWFASQQLGSSFAQLYCDGANLAPMLLLGAVALAVALAGGLMSWGVWRHPANGAERPVRSRSFIAGTGALAALVFALAIVFQTAASLVIPQCHA